MQSYQLYIRVKTPIVIIVGKLGECHFPKGNYIYTGSAKRNIDSRVKRHLSKNKKLRWHIDYLLNNPNVIVEDVKLFSISECELNQSTTGRILIPKFGATDCKQKCMSHLKYVSKNE